MPGVMERKDTQPKKVVILGSTGSIGTSALKVAREIPDYMEVVGLAVVIWLGQMLAPFLTALEAAGVRTVRSLADIGAALTEVTGW